MYLTIQSSVGQFHQLEDTRKAFSTDIIDSVMTEVSNIAESSLESMAVVSFIGMTIMFVLVFKVIQENDL